MRRPLLISVLSVAAACTATGKGIAPEDGDVTYAHPEPEGTVSEWSIGDQEDAGPYIFKQDRIHRIDIELPSESVDSLAVEPYEYVVGDAIIDGATLSDVGVRLRGKIGSFRTLDGKPKVKLDFNAYVDGRRFQGLESLSLNNSVVDCSYLKEALSYRVFEELGVPASRKSTCLHFAELCGVGRDHQLLE